MKQLKQNQMIKKHFCHNISNFQNGSFALYSLVLWRFPSLPCSLSPFVDLLSVKPSYYSLSERMYLVHLIRGATDTVIQHVWLQRAPYITCVCL